MVRFVLHGHTCLRKSCPVYHRTAAILRRLPIGGRSTGLLRWDLAHIHSSMPEKPYDHNQIELKWHERWQDATFYKAEENSAKPKFYVLEMLPYPSGTLHIGHIRNYSIGDALARYKWMRGF